MGVGGKVRRGLENAWRVEASSHHWFHCCVVVVVMSLLFRSDGAQHAGSKYFLSALIGCLALLVIQEVAVTVVATIAIMAVAFKAKVIDGCTRDFIDQL